MQIMGRTQMLSDYSLLDSLDVIKRLGFDGVEVCVEKKDWSLYDLDSLPVEAIRERIAGLGLAPHSFSFHGDFVYDDQVFDLTKMAIALTSRLGTHILVINGAKRKSGDQDEWNFMAERTCALVEIAEQQDVVLAMEFEPGFVVDSTALLLKLFEQIPSPNLAANLDLGHAFLNDPDPLQAIHALGPKIVHGHIENMATGVHDHLLPQDGDMPLGDYLQTLAEVGFTGGLALDLYKYNYEAVAPEAIACLHSLLAASSS